MKEDQFQRVLKACLAQRDKNNIKITQEDYGVGSDTMKWGSGSGCACPLGCLILEEQPPIFKENGAALEVYEAAALLLETSDTEIEAFTTGFDGALLSGKYAEYRPWFDAGRRMADELGVTAALDEPIPYALVDQAA